MYLEEFFFCRRHVVDQQRAPYAQNRSSTVDQIRIYTATMVAVLLRSNHLGP